MNDKLNPFTQAQSQINIEWKRELQRVQQDVARSMAVNDAKNKERQAYENLLDNFIDKIVESGAGPDDPSEYGEWVRKRAESLINAKRKAMDKYDTMESLK